MINNPPTLLEKFNNFPNEENNNVPIFFGKDIDSEGSVCITPSVATEIDNESTSNDSMSWSDCTERDEPAPKRMKTNLCQNVCVWPQQNYFNGFGNHMIYENINVPANSFQQEKRKPSAKKSSTVQLNDLKKVDILRQDLLLHVFHHTGQLVNHNEILRLGKQHVAEKVMRFNKICPKHIVINKIQSRHGNDKGGMGLCIDGCSYSWIHAQLNNNVLSRDWNRLVHPDPKGRSGALNDFISSYSTKQTQNQSNDVVKYPDLLLSVSIAGIETKQQLLKRQYNIKVMKEQYFNKIRTATPRKVTQPLNLTYPRFWVEVVEAQVYLLIVDTNSYANYTKKQPKRPIQSVIGAYVDGSMKMDLAIMSSFEKTEGAKRVPTQVQFELFVHKGYINLSKEGLAVSLYLSGNKERQDWSWHTSFRPNNNIVQRFQPCQMNESVYAHALTHEEIQQLNNSENETRVITNDVFVNEATIESTPFGVMTSAPYNSYAIDQSFPTDLYGKRHGLKRKREEIDNETELLQPLGEPYHSCALRDTQFDQLSWNEPYSFAASEDIQHDQFSYKEPWYPEPDPL